jgi:DNA-binding GntR family transcriptional regulator
MTIKRAGAMASDDPIVQEPIFEIIVKRLRSDILRGAYPPGAPLRMQEIADKYGTSLMPVREALHRLTSEELVVMHPRRGATVYPFDSKKAQEIYELRKVLMGYAAKMAVPAITPEDIEALDRLVAEMDGTFAGSPVEMERYLDLNDRFHTRLYGPCGNETLIKMIKQLDNFARMSMHRFFNSGSALRQFNDEHREIVAALRERDARRVEELVSRHYEKTIGDLVDALNRQN